LDYRNGVISNLGGVLEILYNQDSEFSPTITLEDPLAEHLISLIINFGAFALEVDNEGLKLSVLETLNRIQKGTSIDEKLIKKAFSNVRRYSPPYIDLLEASMLVDNAEKLFSIYFRDTVQ
jgi:hypothetical protein